MSYLFIFFTASILLFLDIKHPQSRFLYFSVLLGGIISTRAVLLCYKHYFKFLDYFVHNHIDIKEKELSHTTYSNDPKITINGKSAIAHNVKVSVNKIEMDLVDYLDLIEDINNYTHFLISQLPNRKERRIHHIAINDAVIEQRKSLSLTRQLEALKEDFPNTTISLEQSKNYK